MRICLIVISLFLFVEVFAQNNKRYTRSEYIENYKALAMEEMIRTGIPASITLSQGILESGDGNSTLALKSNNHFGIKCHDWTGPSVKHNDDAKNECFRKYKSPEYSYKDHSDFLTSKSRYAFLFELKADDYKGWAKGLKKAGYATSPTYASALIGIIEDNKLYEYDSYVLASKGKGSVATTSTMISGRKLYYSNRVKYIVADSNDTYVSLSEELHLFDWQLPKYNEVLITDKLKAGDYVYLQPKRSKVRGKIKSHMVALGENMHLISQKYGIREDKLRKRNNVPDNYEPAPGTVLILRGKLKTGSTPSLIEMPKQEINNPERQIEDDEPEFKIEYDLGS
jgi:LysM repeat protein